MGLDTKTDQPTDCQSQCDFDILTEVLRSFSETTTVHFDIVIRSDHDRLLPNPFQFIIHQSPYASRVYSPKHWESRKVNHIHPLKRTHHSHHKLSRQDAPTGRWSADSRNVSQTLPRGVRNFYTRIAGAWEIAGKTWLLYFSKQKSACKTFPKQSFHKYFNFFQNLTS
jgi:hypothetical protein